MIFDEGTGSLVRAALIYPCDEPGCGKQTHRTKNVSGLVAWACKAHGGRAEDDPPEPPPPLPGDLPEAA